MSEDLFHKITDYLDGMLSPEERQQFEEALHVNKKLSEATALEKRIQEVISQREASDSKVDSLKTTLKEKNKTHFLTPDAPKKKTSLKRYLWPTMGIAASIAVILIISLQYTNPVGSLDTLPTIAYETVRGTEEDGSTKAIDAYNDKEYAASVVLFSELSEKHDEAIRYKHFLGLSYFGSEDWKETIETLKPIADGESLFKDEASYFTALAAKKLEQYELAITYASSISEESNYYAKAQKLLKKIKKDLSK